MRARSILIASAVLLVLAFVLVPDLALAAEGAAHGAAAAHGAEAAGHGEAAVHGPDWVALGLHAFNLTLLLAVLGWFAGPKAKEALKGRAAETKREIDESNRLRKEAREAFEQLDSRLSGFEDQLAQMRTQAEREAIEEREGILARAERDAHRLQEAAERTIRGETAKARMALRRDAVTLAMKLAEERIAGQVDGADDERLSEGFFNIVDEAQATEVPHG